MLLVFVARRFELVLITRAGRGFRQLALQRPLGSRARARSCVRSVTRVSRRGNTLRRAPLIVPAGEHSSLDRVERRKRARGRWITREIARAIARRVQIRDASDSRSELIQSWLEFSKSSRCSPMLGKFKGRGERGTRAIEAD